MNDDSTLHDAAPRLSLEQPQQDGANDCLENIGTRFGKILGERIGGGASHCWSSELMLTQNPRTDGFMAKATRPMELYDGSPTPFGLWTQLRGT